MAEETTANHVVLANAISGLNGDFIEDAQVFVTATEPLHSLDASRVWVELHDAVTDFRRNYVVEIREAT